MHRAPPGPPRSSAADRPARRRPPRAPRSDGTSTRMHILETAGTVFAEKGFSRSTSKEICTRARTHMAAVNYHFGGKDGLYEAVLVEAHRRLVSLERLQEIVRDGTAPERQFATLLRHLLMRPEGTPEPWALRVLVQEMMAPSEHVPVLLREAVLPKVRVIVGLVSRLLALPVGHPGVQRGVLFAVVPAILLLVAPRPLRDVVLPALASDPASAVDELVAYALAGLRALKRRHAARAAEPPARPRRSAVSGRSAPPSRSRSRARARPRHGPPGGGAE